MAGEAEGRIVAKWAHREMMQNLVDALAGMPKGAEIIRKGGRMAGYIKLPLSYSLPIKSEIYFCGMCRTFFAAFTRRIGRFSQRLHGLISTRGLNWHFLNWNLAWGIHTD